MDDFDPTRLNDDGLNAYLFGIVYDCVPGCPEADCPLADLPRWTLSATFDALVAMPRVDKLALLLIPEGCPSRGHPPPDVPRAARDAGPVHDIIHLLQFYGR
ncbi:MAG: hypothetical protein R3298_10290 [Gammaproteobacteria bacterium]|nr:hypothetical protein [Gammaproteobacteria bacterium]